MAEIDETAGRPTAEDMDIPDQEYPVDYDLEVWIGDRLVASTNSPLYLGRRGVNLGEHSFQTLGVDGFIPQRWG
ncbi:hypothetical protein HALLA_09565 [Halostagnicola larsenii XH-48]|uniref:Uncharacterized protein n=1 Tax=Halostagnicola larsenii XH-48 TaxID=797299 RepID=W0JUX2_9EURY|nr:hypothetical protein [Halostagnicola larsenii]AHG00823.1 hypothetical protein HALLA_09400 [Halostagnicola larsenii XH-48]AHG00842.1 hypothetical protein HALLA_09565 [Halostagnicola larsenii XH-48]